MKREYQVRDTVKLKFGGCEISRKAGSYISSIFEKEEGNFGTVTEVHKAHIYVEMKCGSLWFLKESFEYVQNPRELMLEIENIL